MDFDFADILINVMELGASDLHITAASPPMVRLRGRLQPLDYPKLSPQDTREIVYSILTEEQRKRLENDWQIDFSYTIPGRARFRVNAFYQRATVGAAFRLIPTRMPQLKDLGVPSVIEEFTKKPRGFVLVALRADQDDHGRRRGRRDPRGAPGAHPPARGPERVPGPAHEVP